LALIPIPDAADEDLSNAHSIAKAHGYSPVKKVAGARRSKGKQRVEATIQLGSRKRKAVPDLDDKSEAKPIKRGRPQGSGNYSQEDLKALLNLIEAELLLGQQGWIVVHSHGRVNTTSLSLTMFSSLLKRSTNRYLLDGDLLQHIINFSY
jgi:hypothetical protein